MTFRSVTLTVVAAIIWKDGKVLITRRRKGSHLGGLWEFPGGKVESGEALDAALIREIREELDISIEVHDEFMAEAHEYPDRTVMLHFFNCSIRAGDPRPLEADELRWIAISELNDFEFPPADRELIARLQVR